MPVRKGWLPREGFTADVLLRLFKNTALNPTLTLPILLLSYYTRRGQSLAAGHEVAINRLKLAVYLGVFRWINNFLSGGAVNNWSSSRYDWNKEIVVITGGSDGIGKLVALLLHERGAKVAILDIQPLTFEPPPNIFFFKCDIASPEQVSACAASVRSEVGVPTILINNAGIGAGLAVLDTTEESVSKVFQVNILSHFRLIREFVPAMVAANHGTVVTIASIAGGCPAPQIVPYGCTKSAAVALHEGLAAELKVRYKAPKVRTICQAETVAEKIYEKIVSGSSGMVFVPDTAWHLGWILRSLPMWWQTSVRSSGGEYVPAVTGVGKKEAGLNAAQG
ncbi:MAG: hypothetical protein Q9219_006558 [cf. Caloplaca sp. 3 TL-2023]